MLSPHRHAERACIHRPHEVAPRRERTDYPLAIVDHNLVVALRAAAQARRLA